MVDSAVYLEFIRSMSLGFVVAGAIATTLSGQREGIDFGGDLLASCDASLHHEILELLQSTRELPALLLPAPHSIMLHVCNQHPE